MGTAEKKSRLARSRSGYGFSRSLGLDQVCEALGVGGRRQDEGHPREAEAGLI